MSTRAWPLVVFALSQQTLKRTCIALIFLAFVIRCGFAFWGWDPQAIYTFTLCRMDTLLSGALIAILVRSSIETAVLARAARRILILVVPAILAAPIVGWISPVYDVAVYTAGYSLLCACFASMILTAALGRASGRYTRILRNRELIFFGAYSYGLYVIHVPVRAAMVRAAGDPIVIAGSQLPWQFGFFLLCAAITLALALLSWQLMEKRFLKLKKHFPY